MNKFHTVLKWCEIFGIELIDCDGFPRQDVATLTINLETFLKGIVACTINPLSNDKYDVLNALI